MHDLDFDQLVFSGGGARCFWHGGFITELEKAVPLHPRRIAGVSGGALSAAAFIGDREEKLLRVMGEAFEALDSNIRLHKIDEEEGVTPHQRTYRAVVEETLDDAAISAIVDGPEFEVLMARPASRRWPKWSTFPVMAAYQLDLAIRSTPHMRWPEILGVKEILADGREAARDGRLHDLICNAAVIPPVFNVERWEGDFVIDGGMTSKAPLPSSDHGRTLVMLTRAFRNIPDCADRVYVMPSRETPADKIDFTSRAKIEQTWKAGARDARAFLERHRSAPAEPEHVQ